MERRLELISEMTPATWIHLVAAVFAIVVGGLVLFRRKGDRRHRLWGRVWVGAMAVTALSSFLIFEINDNSFSPIHGLAVYTLCSLVFGVYILRRAKPTAAAINAHRRAMQSLYAFGLLIAGGFTFLPFRLLGRLTFGETLPVINYVIVAAMVGGGLWLLVHSLRSSTPEIANAASR